MIDENLFKKILLDEKYISEEDSKKAEEFESSGKGKFIDYLKKQEIINNLTLGRAIGEYYKTIFTDLSVRAPSQSDISKIPENFARQYNLVFVKDEKGTLVVATDNPANKELKSLLKQLFPDRKIKVTFGFLEDIKNILSHYQKELGTRFNEIIKKERRVAPEIFEEIIKDAITYRASDIHFEPGSDSSVIRFRIDGLLRVAGSVPKEYYESVLNRIKIEANLRTDEHFVPQDGAIRFAIEDGEVDLRVSIVPVLNGEKVVIRLLTEYVKNLGFNDLGLTSDHAVQLERAVKKPFGMIIVSGPTGSGKTTTLYALINRLNNSEMNVTTIEDPVEYRMKGVNQIQVDSKTGVNFAKGLRAVLRQDPNVILLGEIRDRETVEVAVNAALTGHLLLSTFHANDSATTIPRLLDMGVEPFLLSSTLELIVAQRLVRKICEACRYSYKDKFNGILTTFYKGKGCSVCNNTGYLGRTSIVEIIEVNQAMKDCIHSKPGAAEVAELARQNGTKSLFEDGFEKAKTGVTTLEEVLRVASPK